MIQDSPAKAEVSIVIDVSHLCYRAYHAHKGGGLDPRGEVILPLKTRDGRFSGHIYGSIKMLVSLFRELNTEVCPIFCYDGHGAKAVRQQILPEYKANRTILEIDPVKEVKQYVLDFLPGLHIKRDGFEGDDAVAWAVNLSSKKRKVIVYSSDKDLWPLMTVVNTSVYSPSKGRTITLDDVFKEFHVKDPKCIYLAKSLFGDPSDGVKGVERLFKKQVEPILGKSCTSEEFYAILDQGKPESMTENMYKKTLEARDRIHQNYAVLIPRIDGFCKTDVKQALKNTFNKTKIVENLTNYECFSVLDEVKGLYNE